MTDPIDDLKRIEAETELHWSDVPTLARILREHLEEHDKTSESGKLVCGDGEGGSPPGNATSHSCPVPKGLLASLLPLSACPQCSERHVDEGERVDRTSYPTGGQDSSQACEEKGRMMRVVDDSDITCGCGDTGPLGRMTVRQVGNVVRVRHSFVCRVHSPVAYLETDHTVAGAEKMALDLLRIVKMIKSKAE